MQFCCGAMEVSTGWDSHSNPTYDGESSHFEIMQYTGLKDKNGVEIYERDFVTAHQFLFDGNEVESQIFGEIVIGEFGVLLKRIKNKFYEDYTGYKPYEGECYLFNFYGLHEDSFEVIGNRFENPELLES